MTTVAPRGGETFPHQDMAINYPLVCHPDGNWYVVEERPIHNDGAARLLGRILTQAEMVAVTLAACTCRPGDDLNWRHRPDCPKTKAVWRG